MRGERGDCTCAGGVVEGDRVKRMFNYMIFRYEKYRTICK